MGPLILQSQALTLAKSMGSMLSRQQRLLDVHYLGNAAAVAVRREDVSTYYIEKCRDVRIGNMLHDLIINQILNLLSCHPVHVLAILYNCPPVLSLTYSNAAFMLNSSLGAYWIPCAYPGVTSLALRAPEKICA